RPSFRRVVECPDDRHQQQGQNAERNRDQLALVPRVSPQDDEIDCEEEGGQREQFHLFGSLCRLRWITLLRSQTSLEGSPAQPQDALRQSLVRARQLVLLTAKRTRLDLYMDAALLEPPPAPGKELARGGRMRAMHSAENETALQGSTTTKLL